MQLASIQDFQALVTDDFQSVNVLIQEALQSKASIIKELGNYVIDSGGKRLRPLVVLLIAKACAVTGEDYLKLAAIIELIHTATLLHDDVVDNAAIRRGKKTANTVWSNEAAVLVGDFLYSKTFQMLVNIGDERVMKVLADATNIMAEGEAFQLLQSHNTKITEADYLYIIRSKTAKLFEVSAQIAGISAKISPEIEKALCTYGLHLGTAFQLMDDILDYDPLNATGKTAGNDLAEGKITLPLIYVLKNGHPEEIKIVEIAIQEGGYQHFSTVDEILKTHGAIEYTHALAKTEIMKAKEALKSLKQSPYTEAAMVLADFAVARYY